AVARAAPDGYTVLLATGSLLAINVSLYKNIGYDPEKDFEPISMIGTQTNVLYAHPSVPATSLAELIAYAKAKPGKLSLRPGDDLACARGAGGDAEGRHRHAASRDCCDRQRSVRP